MIECFRDRRRGVQVTGRAFVVWVAAAIAVSAFHLSLIPAEFRETWYAPLHFLWVVAISSAVAWSFLRFRVLQALVQTGVLLLVSAGVSWAVTRVSWGVGVVGDARLPLGGALLVSVSWFLLAVYFPFLASGDQRKLRGDWSGDRSGDGSVD